MGVEALVRWAHPMRGLIPPLEFIPAAEQSDLIGPLTRWVLNESVGQLRSWQHGGQQMGLSVNLAAANVADPELPKEIEKLLRTWGIAPELLTLEVTEGSALANTADANLKLLRDLGAGLAIDDFGMGYSTLAQLKRVAFTELKLDVTFVSTMVTNDADASIVRPAIALGNNLGLTVVAEGVEDEATLLMLQSMDCHFAQGYHISPALPAADLGTWLKESGWPLPSTDLESVERAMV